VSLRSRTRWPATGTRDFGNEGSGRAADRPDRRPSAYLRRPRARRQLSACFLSLPRCGLAAARHRCGASTPFPCCATLSYEVPRTGVQATHLSVNYAAYWVFRGWLRGGLVFDEAWWQPPRHATDSARRPAPIGDPQRLSVSPFNCIDSGGQFASRNGIPRQADGGIARANSDNVSRIVNRWDEPSFARRSTGATAAYEVLGP